MFSDFKTEIKLFLAVVCVAVVITIGGILLLRTINPPASEQALESKQTQEQAIDMSTWRTYRNDVAGFEIKIPLNWSYNETLKGALLLQPQEVAGDIENIDSFYVVVGVDSAPIPPFIRGNDRNILVNKKSVMIGGIQGEQGEFRDRGVANGPIIRVESVVSRSSVQGPIVYSINLEKMEYRAVYDQILSTFRFVDDGVG